MLSLTINSKQEKLHIGCRTFISLYELLHLLEIKSCNSLDISVNSAAIESHEYMRRMISSGDNLTINYT